MATILYPSLDGAAREARIHLHEPLHQARRATVILRPVKLLHLVGLIGSNNPRGMAAYAQERAFDEAQVQPRAHRHTAKSSAAPTSRTDLRLRR